MQWAVIKPGSQLPHPRAGGGKEAVLHLRGCAENTGSWPISLHLLATEVAAHAFPWIHGLPLEMPSAIVLLLKH